MSAAIEPDMYVEFIRAGPFASCGHGWELTPELTIGAIYRVEDVVPGHEFVDGVGGLTLVEVPGFYPCGQRFTYDIRRFRPIYRPKAEFIAELLAPAPAESVPA